MNPSRLPQLGQYEPTGWASSDELTAGEVRQGLKAGEDGAAEAALEATTHRHRGAPPSHRGPLPVDGDGARQGVPREDAQGFLPADREGRTREHHAYGGPRARPAGEVAAAAPAASGGT